MTFVISGAPVTSGAPPFRQKVLHTTISDERFPQQGASHNVVQLLTLTPRCVGSSWSDASHSVAP